MNKHYYTHLELNKYIQVHKAYFKAWQAEIDKGDGVATLENPPRTVMEAIMAEHNRKTKAKAKGKAQVEAKKEELSPPMSTSNPMMD